MSQTTTCAAWGEPADTTAGYQMHHVLGSGASGTVFAATRLSDNLQVAVKCVHIGEHSDKEFRSAMREAEVLADLNHPNIVKLVDVALEDTRMKLVLERADSGDLTAVLRRLRMVREKPRQDSILFGFVQVALALCHLHGRGILHGDIKPQNILVHKGKFLKLCDFGASMRMQQPGEKPKSSVGGTACYLAPEIWRGQAYTDKSDVWALGCVLYELGTLRQPYDGPMFAVMHRITAANHQAVEGECSEEICSLINNMLQRDPKDRPTMQQILAAPVMQQHVLSYSKVLQQECGSDLLLGFDGLHGLAQTCNHVIATDLHSASLSECMLA